MPSYGYKNCTKCGRRLKETEFYKMKTGERCDLCKDCLCQYIDNRKPETFLWIIEMFDVPYIERKWIQLTNNQYKKDPGKFGPKSVLGLYLRTMNMTQYAQYTFEDSDHLENANAAAAPVQEIEVDEEYETKLRQRLENGEITEQQYNTLTKTNRMQESFNKTEVFLPELLERENQIQEEEEKPTPSYHINESYWTDQLSDEDINYLMLKWGTVYTPQEWITMETMWNKYSNEYELNVDREEVLKKMCKTSLKMDEALDIGDVTGYKNLAAVFDQLRKSGKFTEMQNKEGKERTLDSIGQLVSLCEQHGGIIEALPQFDPEQYPQDKIDFTLKDLQSYTYRLVTNELGLGDLIESYIKKLEEAENTSTDINEGLITSAEEAAQDQLTDEEVADFDLFLENEIEAEAETFAQFVRGER